MPDLRPHICAGDGIWWGQASAEPTPLVHGLLDQASDIGSIRAFVGLTLDQRVARDDVPEVSLISYGALGPLRHAWADGRLTIVPCDYSDLPRLFAERLLPSDVGMIQVSPPDSQGMCSLGLGVEYMADALQHATRVIAEVNEQMPAIPGSPRIHVDAFSEVTYTDRPLLTLATAEPSAVDQAIAEHVAGLVNDGDTIQTGFGSALTAVVRSLGHHRNLGVHSGYITDEILHLWDRGVITGKAKSIDEGKIVTGTAIGTQELYQRLVAMPVDFRPTSYTHSPEVLARLGNLVSINAALEVDLTGQVGAEVHGGRRLGATGGQVDFSRAASTTGARSIIVLRSTGSSGSNIVPSLESCDVTLGRADLDYVVTEHGVAALRGRSLEQRAESLIGIAASEYREQLGREYETRLSRLHQRGSR